MEMGLVRVALKRAHSIVEGYLATLNAIIRHPPGFLCVLILENGLCPQRLGMGAKPKMRQQEYGSLALCQKYALPGQ